MPEVECSSRSLQRRDRSQCSRSRRPVHPPGAPQIHPRSAHGLPPASASDGVDRPRPDGGPVARQRQRPHGRAVGRATPRRARCRAGARPAGRVRPPRSSRARRPHRAAPGRRRAICRGDVGVDGARARRAAPRSTSSSVRLEVGRVGDDRAPQHARRAGHVDERRRDEPAGQRLGDGQRPAPRRVERREEVRRPTPGTSAARRRAAGCRARRIRRPRPRVVDAGHHRDDEGGAHEHDRRDDRDERRAARRAGGGTGRSRPTAARSSACRRATRAGPRTAGGRTASP